MTQVTETPFGEHQGQAVSLFTLTNAQGIRLAVTNYGCIVTQLWLPDRHGRLADVVLGFDTLAEYQAGHPFFGAIAGRCANRIGGGRFRLGDEAMTLACNEAATGQHLHGGVRGFDKYVWQAEAEPDGVRFHRVSPDGEEGYPGTLSVTHRLRLTEDNVLHFEYEAVTDRATPVNLTNHSYYNLSAQASDIRGHQLQIAADLYTPVDPETMLPTGEIHAVAGTPLDFRQPVALGIAMAQQPAIDINYVLRAQAAGHGLHPAATLADPDSGREMRVFTDQPGLQCYNGAKLSNRPWRGKGGVHYGAFAGLCLETQAFPDSVNQPHFPGVVLQPGEVYRHHTAHHFSLIGEE
ncbi:aldose epimerase family protein [Chimaeribacter arupi]|uniref:aldose epimerase family protein n=1 Tax=Chimaeribacter arupi TaxID=2060066 RepID=UPI000C7D2C4E|nr:aldose epimerase family protein [Chimaeribacter arupi]PLR49439.1 galactose-1-epimerase [Chimaeribacter arupi]